MNYPPLTLLTTTYFTTSRRRDVACAALSSWLVNMYYNGGFRVHIADDGSVLPNDLVETYSAIFPDLPITTSRQERGGLGASLNAGFKEAFKHSPIVFYAADDWFVNTALDVTSWIKALLENENIGCIRLGPPHPNLTGKVKMISEDWQGWGLVLNKGGYAYGDRPALFHQRFFDAYGYFTEKTSALECVRLYDEKVARTNGPNIVLALPHPFVHLESESLSDIEP